MGSDLVQVRARYERALESLASQLEADPTVVALVVWGSLAYDEVWERSDIDLSIVRDDRRARAGSGGVVLDVDGVNVHANVTTRKEFVKTLQSSALSWGSQMTLGRIVFTRDESLQRIFDESQTVGERDRRARMLGTAAVLTTVLDKVGKWLEVKRDPHLATQWMCSALQMLASIEVLRHNQVPRREALRQALELAPEFFGRHYVGLLDGPKTVEAVRESHDAVVAYLDEHRDELFGPLLDYLSDEATIRSVSDIGHHFGRRMDVQMVAAACEWLEARGVLARASATTYLTEHSKLALDELAFVWPGPPR